MSIDPVRQRVGAYYTGKLAEHGPTARGVDWSTPESQWLRFQELLRIRGTARTFSIMDYGCGYGALLDYLDHNLDGASVYTYVGYDVSMAMVDVANQRYAERPNVRFTADEADLEPADFAVASGLLNVKLDTPLPVWQDWVRHILDRLDALSIRGFAFNALTSYSDPPRMRPDLYYPDPTVYFDLCKRTYSRHVALLHDYGLWEFTMLVRKQLDAG